MLWELDCFFEQGPSSPAVTQFIIPFCWGCSPFINIPPTLLTAQAHNYAYVMDHVIKHMSFLSNHVQPNHDLFITRRLATQHPQSPLL
ncbi:hypothetical protein VN97_g2757 [Penicillium thymicola]|uniref:Uncharacterized protein n=1 Tax=Penicillium thymicola TaxID=293382 RepID=A0AAI9TNF0_PENTH|nr:hypothetical protein VN97_g2757 [Penicillium thymicola]